MALSPRANATVGPPKEVTSSSANPKTVYPSSSLHHEVVRSADLSCSAGINPGFGSLFGDLDAQRLPLSNFRMELPQSQHSFEGSKPPHDFLSLYGDSSSNCVEHRSSQGISTYLTTQDFLQPLERGGKDVVSSAETSAAAPTTTSGEHVLPGGIGTYTISHVSSYNHTNAKSDPPVVHVNGTEGKPEVTRGSTSSNYAGGGFKLWEERIVVDGGRTDDLAESDSTKEYLEKSGYWSTVRPKVGVSDLSFLAKTSFSLSSVEVNQQLLPSSSKQRHTNQGFVEMMKSIKAISEDDEDEDDEYLDRGRENRKEGSSLKGEAPPKADGKNNEQRANTPRSKHSATEQRRRSKINDRFQTLRELVPHSDQKRDKASFLLEVIEYIQVLQEKVRKYETTEQRWNQERMKTMVWDLCKKSSGLGEMPADGSQTVDGTRLESKQNGDTSDSNRSRLTSNTIRDENSIVTADMLPNSQNPLQSNKSSPVIPGCAPYKEKECTGVYNKSIPLPLSMQQCVYSPFGRSMMHNIHPKAQTTSEMQSLPGVQAITPSCMPINVYSFEKEKVGDSAAPVQLPYLQGNNATAMKTTNTLENHWSDLRSSQPSSTQQDSIRNQGMLLKDEATDTKSEAKLELQNSNAYFNSSTRISQYTTQSEAELASRQQQQPTSSTDRHRTDESRLAANEQEQLAIQGGVINVSSVYSQGLLDTLTQALQSSGLDLSQANISVQIELGRRGGTSMATTNIKEHSQNQEESSQTHQLQGQSRAADTASECEQPPKRPKIERDL